MGIITKFAVATTAVAALTQGTVAQAATTSPRPATRTVSTLSSSPRVITATVPTKATTIAAVRHRAAWRATAIKAFAMAEAATVTHGTTPFVEAALTRAAANLYGWKDPRTTNHLRRVLAAQHPDGGWGIDEPMDTFQDGTVNPAGTTYTVTTADHVGPLLVDGYRAGVISRDVLDRARKSLLATPRMTTRDGACISYSNSGFDNATPTRCVNNVNAAAGWFLTATIDLGIATDAETRTVAAQFMAYDARRVLPAIGRWPYSGATTKPQDLDHNSLNVEAHILADGGLARSPFGAAALSAALAAPLTADYTDRLAWIRLSVFDPAQSYRWQPYGEWMLQNTPRTATRPGYVPRETTIRYAQVALYSSRSALDAL